MMIALEWDAQTNIRTGLQPATMPLTILAFTAEDTVKPDGSDAINTCLRFLPTDSALFFTQLDDRQLLKKQRQHLQPVVKWAHKEFGLQLATTDQMTARVAHSPEVGE